MRFFLAVIPPEDRFYFARVMTEFDALLEEMVDAYFGDGTSVRRRIAHLRATREKMRSLLRGMRS
jgi:hypothetical protein